MTRRSAPLDTDTLLQRDPYDDRPRGTISTPVRGRPARPARPASRKHALDEGPRDLDAAYRHLYGALDHVHAARAGKVDFDAAIYDDHVSKAADCLKGGGEDEAAEETEDDSTEAERERAAAEAADDVGEVASRSAVETAGSGNPDRKSPSGGTSKGGGRWGGAPSNASSMQGADSALDGFDVDALMQREGG